MAVMKVDYDIKVMTVSNARKPDTLVSANLSEVPRGELDEEEKRTVTVGRR